MIQLRRKRLPRPMPARCARLRDGRPWSQARIDRLVHHLQAVGEAANVAGEALRHAGALVRIAADDITTALILDWIGIAADPPTGGWGW